LTGGRWTSIRVRSPADRSAIVSALFDLGAEGIQELDDCLVTHVRDIDRSRADEVLRRVDPEARIDFEPTPDVDWTSEWRRRITAHRVGAFVVTPPWLADQFSDRERIVIEPAMAFGTGEHESTRGALRLVQLVVRAGDVVADVGAGSAVLSIAAAKLGAARVVAIELDSDAIGNAEDNIAANGVADRVSVLEGDGLALLPLVGPFRVVIANIVSSVLVELLPTMREILDPAGAAILGGMLASERNDMIRAFEQGGWMVRHSDEEASWWSAVIAPRP
jgi:ribosomal protein L11 methyltransferase